MVRLMCIHAASTSIKGYFSAFCTTCVPAFLQQDTKDWPRHAECICRLGLQTCRHSCTRTLRTGSAMQSVSADEDSKPGGIPATGQYGLNEACRVYPQARDPSLEAAEWERRIQQCAAFGEQIAAQAHHTDVGCVRINAAEVAAMAAQHAQDWVRVLLEAVRSQELAQIQVCPIFM